jgi:hypothetical protein
LQQPEQPVHPAGAVSQVPVVPQIWVDEQTVQALPKLPQAATVGGSTHVEPLQQPRQFPALHVPPSGVGAGPGELEAQATSTMHESTDTMPMVVRMRRS